MHVTYFRPQRSGPEAAIENAVANRLCELFGASEGPKWAGASVPIGAGLPDLLLAVCHPDVLALSKSETSTTEILAYLRAVSRASLETITQRVHQPRRRVTKCLDILLDACVVSNDKRGFFLSPVWRSILPDVVAIEAKVSNWRKACSQACRNRIFAHRSFVAFPTTLAQRTLVEPSLVPRGIGVLGVSAEGDVSVVRQANRNVPRVWSYYYQIASLAADHLSDDLCHSVFT